MSADDADIPRGPTTETTNGDVDVDVDANNSAPLPPTPKPSSSSSPAHPTLVDDFLDAHETWSTYDGHLRTLERWLAEDDDDPRRRRQTRPMMFVKDLAGWLGGMRSPPPFAATTTTTRCDDEKMKAAWRDDDGFGRGEEDGKNKKIMEGKMTSTTNTNTTNTTTTTNTTEQNSSSYYENGDAIDERGSLNSLLAVTPNAATISLEVLSDALFRPGMKFAGRIFIPGTTTTSEKGTMNASYELTILQRGTDALGNEFILAQHRAHDDEQAVHLQVKVVDVEEHRGKGGDAARRLEVEYADGETVCRGMWNSTGFRLEGHVHQRIQINDGVFHSSDSATHVFTLYPCTYCFHVDREGMDSDALSRRLETAVDSSDAVHPSLSPSERDMLSRDTRAIADYRSRTQNAKLESLNRYDELCRQINITSHDIRVFNQYYEKEDSSSAHTDANVHLDEKQQILLKLRNCDWAEMLVESVMLGERLCAEFRRRSSMLDDLSFETSEDRERCMDQWKAARMDLAAAHASWDEWMNKLQRVFMGIFIFEKHKVHPAFQIRHRLFLNFECLDGAFRRASTRMPRRDFSKFDIPCTRELMDHACIICQSPLLDSDDIDGTASRVYKLPCSHFFHKVCVKTWLHDHPSCPVCRYNLTKSTT